MEIVFLIGVIWLAYTYAGYPLLLAALALVRRVRPIGTVEMPLPGISVLIAARNEEQDIGWKIAETLAWEYPPDKLEVLVASDASDDLTDHIVRGFEDRRVRLLRMGRRSGKVRALNRLAAVAEGDVLLFTDANAHIPADCARKLVRHFADPRVGCVTGGTRPGRPDAGAVERGAGAYLGYEALVTRLEDRIGSVLVCDGAIHCVRRSLYTPLEPDLANDLELPARIAAAGYRTEFEPDACVIEKETESPGEEFRRRRRISAQGALGYWRLRGQMSPLRTWQFLSHKFLRWLTLLPLAMVFGASCGLAHRPAFAVLAAVQWAAYLTAAAGFSPTSRTGKFGRALAVPFFVLLGSAATLCGIWDSCRGRRFDVWEIPGMSRGGARLG